MRLKRAVKSESALQEPSDSPEQCLHSDLKESESVLLTGLVNKKGLSTGICSIDAAK